MAFVRRLISKFLDPENLKNHNDNFADNETDLTNHNGRITTAQSDITTHKESTQAHVAEHIAYAGPVAGATNMKGAVDSVQQQLNQAVIEGDSSPAANQAKVSSTGITYDTLKDRLDDEHDTVNAQLADTAQSPYINGAVGALVTPLDDDGTTAFITKLQPILDAEGVKATLAINPGLLGVVSANATRLVLSDLLTLQAAGHEMVSHGNMHINMSVDQTDAALDAELHDAKQFMKANGLLGYDYFVYPNGVRATDYRTQGFVRKYHKCGINITNGVDNVPPLTQFNMKRYSFDSMTLAQAKAVVDTAITKNEWIIFLTHSWQSNYDSAKLADYQALLQYIKSLSVSIVSVAEGLARQGNVIDYQVSADRYFKVSRTGVMSTNLSQNLLFLGGGDATTLDSAITTYQANSISVRLYATGYSNAPIANQAGVCLTYRMHTDQYSYQEWTAYRSADKFIRYWDTTNNVWLAWRKVQNLFFGSGSGSTLDAAISTYPQGSVSHHSYPTGLVSAPVTNAAGMCMTFRHQSSDNYSYQEWTTFITGVKYVRFWDSTNSVWRTWNAV